MNTASLLLAVLALPSGDWPCWRGPDRDGVSKESGWSNQGRELWRARVGLGYADCTVVGERVYTSGHDEEKGEDAVVCLDAGTGDGIWSRVVATTDKRANFHTGGTLSTVVVDGDALFVSQRDGHALRLDAATGDEVWRRNYAEELGVDVPIHGFPSSPVVVDGVVIYSVGGVVLGASKENGSALWKSEPIEGGFYSTPTPFDLDGHRLLAVFASAGLAVLDRAGGEQLAFHGFSSNEGVNATSPVVMGDRIFISAAYGMGGELLHFTGDSLNVLWGTKRMRNKVQTCVEWEGHLYGFDEAMLKCISIEDGKERWRKRGLGMGCVAASDGRLLVTTSKGEFIVAEANSDAYVELAREDVMDGGVYWTTPTLANGRVYLRSSLGEIVCRDHRPAAGGDVAEAGSEPLDAPGELPAAEALLTAHVAAIGGEAAWRELAGMRIEGKFDAVSSGLTEVPATWLFRAPDAMRLTVDMGFFGVRERGHTGGPDGVAWKADPFWGPEVFEGDDRRNADDEARLLRYVDWASTYAKLETRGVVAFDGRSCFHVAAAMKAGGTRSLYFDVADGMLAGHESETEPMVVYRDYARFGGVLLARQWRILAPESGEEESLRIETVDFEAPEPEAFEPPEPIQQLLMSDEEVEAANARMRELYGDLMGTYEWTWEGRTSDVEVGPHFGKLAFHFSEGNPSQLAEPEEGEERWVFAGMPGMWVKFVRDEEGEVTKVIAHMMGEDSEMPRKRE